MQERVYQTKVIKRLRKEFVGCFILKNDSDYMQGVPDLSVFYGPNWAILEVKASRDSDFQPNQEYYVSLLNQMSYASVIYPENEDEVFAELHRVLSRR